MIEPDEFSLALERANRILEAEHRWHLENRRRLIKAEHDRDRYKRRIRFLQERHAILSREYNAIRKERDIIQVALTACERRLHDAET